MKKIFSEFLVFVVALLYFGFSSLSFARDTLESVRISYEGDSRGCYYYKIKNKPEEAVEGLLLAAKKGVPDAYLLLGEICDETKENIEGKDSLYYYKEAALCNQMDVQLKAAIALFNRGITDLAMDYFSMLADRGNAEAQTYMAYFVASGINCQKDDKRAFEYYSSAAEQGNAEAQFNLAHFFNDGRGIGKDLFNALELYHLAKINGLQQAKAKFEALELKLRNELNEEYRALHRAHCSLQCEKSFLERNRISKIRRQSLPAKIYKKIAGTSRAGTLQFTDEVEAIFYMRELVYWLKAQNAQCAQEIETLKGNNSVGQIPSRK